MRYTLLSIVILLFFHLPTFAEQETAGNVQPFAVVRASLDENRIWTVDRFVLFPDTGPPSTIAEIPHSDLVEYSLIDYALFRARYISAFEGGLKRGLSVELAAREKIKSASGWGTYLFCPPAWPVHLAWGLSLAGAEKERNLDREGLTIQIPSAKGSGIGEISATYTNEGLRYSLLPDLSDPVIAQDWGGVGLRVSYTTVGDLTLDGDLYPGWGNDVRGEVVLLLDVPSGSELWIADNWGGGGYNLGRYPGRFESPTMKTVVLNHEGRVLTGMRWIRVPGIEQAGVSALKITSLESGSREGSLEPSEGEYITLRNVWPETGSLSRDHPLPVLLLPGMVILVFIFHLVNPFVMKISYRRKLLDALIDPIAVHIVILISSSLFAPFLGLGWIVGAYPAWRYLSWRHGNRAVRWPWLLVIPLLTTLIYEAVFADIIWV